MTSDENNPLLPKLKKLYDLKLENDEELLDGLASLSLIFNENNIRNRRNLRGTIERQGVDIRKKILSQFKAVVEETREMNKETRQMNQKCQSMSHRLRQTKCQTRELIEKTTKLQMDARKLEMKKRVAEAFCQKFQLSAADVSILTAPDAPVDARFLAGLERLRHVEADCRLLLRLGDQTIGLETLDRVAGLCDVAYERLFTWARTSVAALSGASECEVGEGLAQAMARLSERPVLLRHVLDEFRQARRQACEREFVAATGTDSVERHAHDPLRFASDMLACLHQLAAGEREHCRALLRLVPTATGSVTGTSGPDDGAILDTSPDVACEGLCRPFKMRMEQLLVTEQDTVTLYKIYHFIKFYKSTLSQLAGGALLACMEESQMLAWRLFCGRLQTCVSANGLLDQPPAANESVDRVLPRSHWLPHSLEPTGAVRATLRLLEDVLAARDISMTPANSDNKIELQQILQTVVEPLLQHCSLSASQSGVGSVEAAVYLANCLYECQASLARFEFTGNKLEQIQGQLEANIDSLVGFQAGYVLRGCGMAELYELVETKQLERLADRIPETSIRRMMTQFDSYLGHPDSLTLPQLALLTSSKLRSHSRRRSHDLVHHAYARIYHALQHSEVVINEAAQTDTAPVGVGASTGFSAEQVATLLPRTPQQVADLILNC